MSTRFQGLVTRRRLLAGSGGALLAFGVGAWLFRPRPSAPPPDPLEVEWMFEAIQRGAICATPLVSEDRIYLAALHDTAFRNSGALYCLDRHTGKECWRFDDAGKMQHTFSSPCLVDGRLYFGEGMHANFVCKLYCLDARTGRKNWDFEAEGHIESSPCVEGGLVYFGAGDDGLHALDAVTGKKRWRFAGPYHIDSSPVARRGKVWIGGGISRVHRTTEVWCLESANGKVVWRHPTGLPVWGSPLLGEEDVYFGLGNGRLLTGPEPPDRTAGGVLCLSASTGAFRWRHDVGDAVFGRVALGSEFAYLGARDGSCRSLDRTTGSLVWKHDLGSPIVASPVLVGRQVVALSSGGKLCGLSASSGRRIWDFDVARHSRSDPQIVATPVFDGVHLYLGTELKNPVSSAAVLYCMRMVARDWE